MSRSFTVAAVSVGLLLSGLSTAYGQALHSVQRSGRVFHAAVCPGPKPRGGARCHAHMVTDNVGNPLVNRTGTAGTPAGYGANTLRTAYGVASLAGSSTTTIAIVDAYGYTNAEADLGVYRAQYGLPACTTANGCFKKVNQFGASSYPRQNTGWAQETALDLDMASAMCPNCKILLVEANSNNFNDLATAENYAAAHAQVVSNSYGGSEAGTQAYDKYFNHPGVVITVSSGDSGYGVEFPASSEFVTAVGGTSLYVGAGGAYQSETGWSGAGSGCSAVYGKPAWQTDTGCANRTVADVSAVADPNTGVAAYAPVFATRSAWVVFGGTSVAAPLVAGIYAVTGTANPASTQCTSGYASCYPYKLTGALHDVTSGSNGSCGGSYLCTAKVGYDGPTGLGTPNGGGAF
jgi:subtilase family serine protease